MPWPGGVFDGPLRRRKGSQTCKRWWTGGVGAGFREVRPGFWGRTGRTDTTRQVGTQRERMERPRGVGKLPSDELNVFPGLER